MLKILTFSKRVNASYKLHFDLAQHFFVIHCTRQVLINVLKYKFQTFSVQFTTYEKVINRSFHSVWVLIEQWGDSSGSK